MSPRPGWISRDLGGLARTRSRRKNSMQSVAWLEKGCAVANLSNCSLTPSNPVSPTKFPARRTAAADCGDEVGCRNPLSPSAKEASTFASAPLPLTAVQKKQPARCASRLTVTVPRSPRYRTSLCGLRRPVMATINSVTPRDATTPLIDTTEGPERSSFDLPSS